VDSWALSLADWAAVLLANIPDRLLIMQDKKLQELRKVAPQAGQYLEEIHTLSVNVALNSWFLKDLATSLTMNV
jgi:hypothetical protein